MDRRRGEGARGYRRARGRVLAGDISARLGGTCRIYVRCNFKQRSHHAGRWASKPSFQGARWLIASSSDLAQFLRGRRVGAAMQARTAACACIKPPAIIKRRKESMDDIRREAYSPTSFSHVKEGDTEFKNGGLRDFFEYR